MPRLIDSDISLASVRASGTAGGPASSGMSGVFCGAAMAGGGRADGSDWLVWDSAWLSSGKSDSSRYSVASVSD